MGFHSSIACSLLLGSEIVARYERPFPRLRPLLCLAQRSFPLFAGVVLSALLCKDGIRNFEDAMRRAMEAGGVPGTVEAPLRWGLGSFALARFRECDDTNPARKLMAAHRCLWTR